MNRALYRISYGLLLWGWLLYSPPGLEAQAQSTQVDTTRKVDQKLLPGSEPAQLQLPDVLIYGNDRSLRISGDKLSQPWDDARPISPQTGYQPMLDELDPAKNKNQLQSRSKGIGSRTLCQLDIGRFQKFNIAAGHWQDIRDYHFGAHGTYNRSSGQYKNSQFSQGAVQAQFSFPPTPQLTFFSQFDFYWANYGLYGSTIEDLERRKIGGSLKIESQWTIDIEQSANFGFAYQQTNFHDSNGDEFDSKGRLRHIGLTAGYQTNYWNIPIHWRAGYEYQGLTHRATDSTNSKNYLYLGASSSFSFKDYVTIRPSVLFENLDVNDSLSAYQLWPSIELVAMPFSQLGLRLRVSKELSPYNYVELVEKNPFLSLRTIFVPMRNELELRIGGEYTPTSSLSLNAEVIRQSWRSFGFWVREPDLGLLELGEFDKVRLTTLKFQTRYRLSPRASLDASLQWQFEQIDQDSAAQAGDRVPYLERLRLPLNLDYQIDRSTRAVVSMVIIGPRYADRNNTQRLAGLALISARCDRRLMKNITAYGEINNLLNQKYQLWEKYPGQGFYFEIGLKGNW